MKYMIMMFGDQGTMVESRSTEWIRSMIGFMQDLEQEFRGAGEYVDGQGLADPTQAKTRPLRERRPRRDRRPVRRGEGIARRLLDPRCRRGARARDRVPDRRVHRRACRGAPGHGRAA